VSASQTETYGLQLGMLIGESALERSSSKEKDSKGGGNSHFEFGSK
jgi:hypothetical protein